MISNGNFYGRYEVKLAEYESRIKSCLDPYEKKEIEQEMYDYMAGCIPYMNKYAVENKDKHTIDSIFGGGNTKNKKGIHAAYIRAREYTTIRGTKKYKNIASKAYKMLYK